MVLGGVERWIPVVVVAVAALPLAWLAFVVLARHAVRRGTPPERARRKALAEVGMVAGTVPWLWMILTPLPFDREINLVPVTDLLYVLDGSPLSAFFQIVGNLLVFAAFGFFAPRRWPIGPLAVTALAALGSAVVEALQYALALGRVTSLDDVLLNAAGAGLAALLSARIR